MKTPYVKFLRILIAIAYYGLIIVLIVVGAALIFNYFQPQSTIQISMDIPIQLKNKVSFQENGWAGSLISSGYSTLSINLRDSTLTQKNAVVYLVMGLAILLSLSLTIWLLYQIRQLLRTMGTSAVFSGKNVVRIRTIGGLLIALELAKPLLWWIISHNVLGVLIKQRINFNDEQINFGNSNLLLGLLVLGLAEVFRSGYQLKQEQELTI
jgi:hypothetical protein